MQEGVEKRPLADDPANGIGVEAEEVQGAGSEEVSPQQDVAEVEAVEEPSPAIEEGVEQDEDTGEEASEGTQPVMEQAAEEAEDEAEDDESAAEAPVEAVSVEGETIPPATRPGLAEREDEPVTMESLLQEEYDFRQPRRGDILSGVVISVGSDGILVDVGVKQEGIVPASDIEKLEEAALKDIKVGDEIPVYVLRPRDRNGNLLLSIHRAQAEVDWTRAQKLMESGEMWEGKVSSHNQGGLVVQFGKIRGFLPASQVVGIPRHLADGAKSVRLESLVGEPLPLKVIEVDRRRRRLIFSHRAAWWEWKEIQRDRLLEELKEGDVRTGVVSSLRDFGVFVDLGGADGLVHVSELAWHRVKHPGEILKVGDEIEVYVLNVDRDRKRIGLSRKRLKPEPWSVVEDTYNVDQLVEGMVTRVVDFGAFVKINNGIEGLVHRSELADIPPQRTSDLVKEGDLLLLRIIRIEADRRRIGLSLRRVTEEEWSEWAAKFRQEQAEAIEAEGEEEEYLPADESEAEEPATEEPETEEPAAEEPVETEEPVAEEPVETEEPIAEEPVETEEPIADAPVETEEPAADAPVETEEPIEAEEAVIEDVVETPAEEVAEEADAEEDSAPAED